MLAPTDGPYYGPVVALPMAPVGGAAQALLSDQVVAKLLLSAQVAVKSLLSLSRPAAAAQRNQNKGFLQPPAPEAAPAPPGSTLTPPSVLSLPLLPPREHVPQFETEG